MSYLIDTSVLTRYANTADLLYPTVMNAMNVLRLRQELIHSTPQNHIEFRSVATRPANVNGLGLSTADTEAHIAAFESLFPLLPDIPDIYPAWKALVSAAGVIGKQVHDARLAAVCQVYGITHLLTFNIAHFTRLATFISGLTVVDPANV